MQSGANLVRGEGLPATFGSNNEHTGCGDAGETC
jgi:hypothetical protein